MKLIQKIKNFFKSIFGSKKVAVVANTVTTAVNTAVTDIKSAIDKK